MLRIEKQPQESRRSRIKRKRNSVMSDSAVSPTQDTGESKYYAKRPKKVSLVGLSREDAYQISESSNMRQSRGTRKKKELSRKKKLRKKKLQRLGHGSKRDWRIKSRSVYMSVQGRPVKK